MMQTSDSPAPPAAPPDHAPRLAAIDIGSNSIRLVVAEPLPDGRYRVLDEERESTRLGRALSSTGRLEEQAIVDSLSALGRFKKIAEGFDVEVLRTIATCAVREAKNGPEFCGRAAEDLGLKIEVISSEREADLAFYSVRRSFDLENKNTALADTGGGSTEIVLASGDLVEAMYATDLGSVRIHEMFGDDYDKMIRWIRRRLKKLTSRPATPPQLLIGSGGTFTSLAAMIMAEKNQEGLPVRGYQISRAELKHLLQRLRKMSPKQRRDVQGLAVDRSDIIVPGLAIIDGIMRRFKINRIQVHNRGVRDGLMLRMIDGAGTGEEASPPDRDAAVKQFARMCGADLSHSEHAARLAGQMHEQLAATLALDSADRHLLETAARLQDVGYLINYNRHHKHSYHLILNSRLEGFQPRELELIANIARYHRRAEPKMKHANFRQLAREDRRRVRQLSAILRLAGGLDRSHSQQVSRVTLEVDRRDGSNSVELTAHAPTYPEVDLWAARRRAGLFEKVFDTALAIEWAGSA